MNGEQDEAIREEAARWHLASEDDAMDWDGFTRWLEADVRHQSAYDEVALADAALADHRRDLRIADERPAPVAWPAPIPARKAAPRRFAWAGAAIAASLVALVSVPQFLAAPSQIYQTQRAAQRIALADGSSIVLAPRSRLTVSGRKQEQMALAGGALFDIHHDPDRALTIAAGDVSIRDIGTRFDVQAESNRVRVAVAEGSVEVAGDALAQPVRLAAGRGLAFDAVAGTSQVAAVREDDVGAWQQGRLSYEDAPLALVAADLGRYAGARIEVPDALRARRFSGTLIVGDGDAAIRDLAQVMGLRLGGRPGAWRLEQPAG